MRLRTINGDQEKYFKYSVYRICAVELTQHVNEQLNSNYCMRLIKKY